MRCAEMSDVRRAAAEKLEMRLTESNIRNKRRYVRKIRDEQSLSTTWIGGTARHECDKSQGMLEGAAQFDRGSWLAST